MYWARTPTRHWRTCLSRRIPAVRMNWEWSTCGRFSRHSMDAGNGQTHQHDLYSIEGRLMELDLEGSSAPTTSYDCPSARIGLWFGTVTLRLSSTGIVVSTSPCVALSSRKTSSSRGQDTARADRRHLIQSSAPSAPGPVCLVPGHEPLQGQLPSLVQLDVVVALNMPFFVTFAGSCYGDASNYSGERRASVASYGRLGWSSRWVIRPSYQLPDPGTPGLYRRPLPLRPRHRGRAGHLRLPTDSRGSQTRRLQVVQHPQRAQPLTRVAGVAVVPDSPQRRRFQCRRQGWLRSRWWAPKPINIVSRNTMQLGRSSRPSDLLPPARLTRSTTFL